ncbi:hypothetical protein [Thermococcus thioreducens]|uniref:Uncharacterized protein n=1 Tax=Thermococcus thioreducens TaxID=277988 RepID=A0A0Q2ULA9_9EURY|nr:hypothetical protein [Thermococcus thioreducens]ASJ13449.1 hypothetical protein A3L14_11415 [Thermococcus thioreducens]KQH81432.1 hypothetical protein AMR53_11415 [Thermococcus thioreducens]SEV97125.1 hypothetical protein SAMN05216170_1167 [Thermococcus thioreducens]
MQMGTLFFLLVVLIIATIFFLAFMSQKKAREKAEELKNAVEIRDGKVALPRRMKLAKGRFLLKGHWSSTGRSRSYHVDRKFIKESELETDVIEPKPERFTLVMARDEETLIDVPAYLVLEPEFEGLLLIPIVPSYRIEVEKQSLEASREMEFAHARIEVGNNGFWGKLYANLQKCRGVRIELKTKTPKAIEKLAETRESAEFRKEFLKESLLIISHRNATDPRHFSRILGRKVFIEGHGEYTLELTLDVPFGKDVHDKATLRVEPSEEPPEGEVKVEVVV